MKKIPTLFKREFENGKIVGITNQVQDGLEWVLAGEGTATLKYDGSCCAVIDGQFYKRFDAKPGRTIPEGAIPCCEPDPITGHHPHWVKCDRTNPSDKWFWRAYDTSLNLTVIECWDVSYEAVGKHFNGNPYGMSYDLLVRHGDAPIIVKRDFESIKKYLAEHPIEGIVFWKDGEPKCKIKRTDFGLPWPVSKD